MSKFSSVSGSSVSGGRSLVWFRGNDLRVQDHAPLFAAHTQSENVDHCYVFDPRQYRTTALGVLKTGLRRLDFTCECLADLDQSLVGLRTVTSSAPPSASPAVHVLVGHPETVIPELMQSLGASKLFTHSDVTEEEQTVLHAVTRAVDALGARKSSNVVTFWGGGTLVQPDTLPLIPLAADLSALGFFTSFRKQVEGSGVLAQRCQPGPRFPPKEGFRPPAPALVASGSKGIGEMDISVLGGVLLSLGAGEVERFVGGVGGCVPPTAAAASASASASVSTKASTSATPLCPDTYTARVHDPRSAFGLPGGETAAWARVQHYFGSTKSLSRYKETRNGMLGRDYSSKLSVYLAHGCITARQVMDAVKSYEKAEGANESTYWLIFELLWRDYMRFYSKKYGKKVFLLGGAQGPEGVAKWPWSRNAALFERWARGQTGYPLIDANMRELALTGFMSNRGRQIVASFLVRDLGLDWRLGAQHFEALLLDHDVCSNWGNWQYAAGVGADPREDRYFNPVKQGNDYDPQGAYVRAWLPELRALPTRLLLDPRQSTGSDRAPLGPMACSLWMDRQPKASFPPGGGGGGRGGGGGSGGGRGKMGGQGGRKGHQHGSVPGRR